MVTSWVSCIIATPYWRSVSAGDLFVCFEVTAENLGGLEKLFVGFECKLTVETIKLHLSGVWSLLTNKKKFEMFVLKAHYNPGQHL